MKTRYEVDDAVLESVNGGFGIAELKVDADQPPDVEPLPGPPGGDTNGPWPEGNDGPGLQEYDQNYNVG